MKKITALILIMLLIIALFSGCSANDSAGMYYYPEDFNYFNKGDTDLEYTEGQGEIVENPFVIVSKKSTSTFSADVDTASYSFFRKLVNEGTNLKTLSSYANSNIRTEEMVNYFDYSYVEPTEGELFGINASIADCPWNTDAKLMVIGLQTEKATPAKDNNLVFLIDVSGSMGSSDKLDLIKTSFSYLVQNLDENDRVSIVTYSGKEEVVLSGCEGNKHTDIMSAIRSLEAKGITNGEAGIIKAYQIAEENYIQGGNNRIILASDGDLNVGISSPEELEALISEKKDSGVYLSVLGFGTGNYRDANMETLADKGNGIYYYIDGVSEAEKIFGNDLFSTLYTIAEDVKLQINFNEEYVEKYRLIGYENRLLDDEDFDNDRKDAGEIGAGHSVTVCYELILTDKALEASEEWLTLSVRYKNIGETASLLNEYKIGKEAFTEDPDDDFRFVCSVIETSLILRESRYIDSDLSLSNVEELLASLKDYIESDYYKTEFKELIAKIKE